MSSNICYTCGAQACIFEEDLENNISYYMCKECGKVWRSIAGHVPDQDIVGDEVTVLEGLPSNAFEAYTELAVKPTMSDHVHKCFLCQSISFEVELGFYQCSNIDCGFSWEVFDG